MKVEQDLGVLCKMEFYIVLAIETAFSGTVAAVEKEQQEAESGRGEPDQTIEILMSDLDPQVMDIFTREHSHDAAYATKVTRFTD